jgi:hypothetical protein
MANRATLLQMRSVLRPLLGLAALISLSTSPLEAQLVELRPIAHVSLPTRISLNDGTIHLSQKVGLRFGARATLTFSNRFDVTNTVTYSPGYATLHGAGRRINVTSGSHSLAGSSMARYWLRPRDGALSWEVHTGLGIVFGGRPSYMDLFDGSIVSAVLGTALRYQVGRIVSFTLRVQQRLLRLRLGDQDGKGSRPFQVAFALGLPFFEKLHLEN